MEEIKRSEQLEQLCKEWLNSNQSENNFGKRFYDAMEHPQFPYLTFTHEFRIDGKHEFKIKLTKYPFLKPKIDITLYDINNERVTFNRLKTYHVIN